MWQKDNLPDCREQSTSLQEALETYCASDAYPLHMPGHKRSMGLMGNPYRIDITEIDGFDNLHHAQGILAQAQQRAAQLYGAKESFFLIGSSTAGLLSAIAACAGGKELLMGRNCHKSVYHAAYLNRLDTWYLQPEMADGRYGIFGKIAPQTLRQALREHPGCRAVVVTSPTYEGIVSDIAALADECHKAGAVLIVDEAHGAHFGMHPAFPASAVTQGADVVIQSLHKTLPCLTQTGLLHICSDRVDRDRIARMLSVYQSSSPSYVLMASMDSCLLLMRDKGKELFEAFMKNMEELHEGLKDIRCLDILSFDDPGKIMIAGGRSGLSGKQICDILRKVYHLEPEMCTPDDVLCMMTVGDTKEGFSRLKEAVLGIEESYPGIGENVSSAAGVMPDTDRLMAMVNQRKVMSLHRAWDAPYEYVPLCESTGRISADFLSLYPPGIPMAAPGERIDEALAKQMKRCLDAGLELTGVCDQGTAMIRVLSGQ